MCSRQWLARSGRRGSDGLSAVAEHVRVVGDAVRRLKARRSTTYLCDPVIGDEPKGIYIDTAAATAIRDQLLPLADIVTPNRFELGWLAGVSCETIEEVARIAGRIGPAATVVTSAEIANGSITTLMEAGGVTRVCSGAHFAAAPRGTGDLFSGLLIGHRLNGDPPEVALGRAVSVVEAVVAASAGRDELNLTDAAAWRDVAPAAVMIR